ncbi:MAG: AAA family ATPase [Solirubrobacteraceae bacterium]
MNFPSGGITLTHQPVFPNFPDEVSLLRQQLEFAVNRIRQLEAGPVAFAVVTRVSETKAMIATGAMVVELERPPMLPLKRGSVVRIRTQPGNSPPAILTADDYCACAKIFSVKSVIEDGMLELDVGQPGASQIVMCALEPMPKAGDRVMLDQTGQTAVRNLGQGDKTRVVTHATGVSWDDIGGQDEAKQALIEAIEWPVLHAELYKSFGQTPSRGVLVHGWPGCVDGDAEVTINRGGKGFRLPLREVVRRFNGVRFNGAGKQAKRTYTWDPAIPTMVRCFFAGEFRLRRIVGAYPKGVKRVVKVTLADGKVLRLTHDHEVLQPGDVWTQAEKLRPGERVITNGVAAEDVRNAYRYLHKGYWIVETSLLANHPHAAQRDGAKKRMPEHRLVAEAALNGVSYTEWMEKIRANDLAGAKFLKPEDVVHHKNEDTTDNRPENLEITTKAEHHRHHALHDGYTKHLPVFLPKSTEVVSVVDDGETEVFDITVEEAHNFVANGIVVHNCGKTMLGKAAATALARVHHKAESSTGFIYVKGPDILRGIVGESEKQIRELFAQARAHHAEHGYPAIVFIDEADAILTKRGMSLHQGMERTIVPQFLSEMDGLFASCAFVLLATNRPDTLDPAVVREGRIDRKIEVKKPDRKAARAIASKRLHGRPCGRGGEEGRADDVVGELFDSARVLCMIRCMGGDDRRFTLGEVVSGAMVVGAVERATQIAIRRATTGGTVGITGQDVREAVDGIVTEQASIDHTTAVEDFIRPFREKVVKVERASDKDSEPLIKLH